MSHNICQEVFVFWYFYFRHYHFYNHENIIIRFLYLDLLLHNMYSKIYNLEGLRSSFFFDWKIINWNLKSYYSLCIYETKCANKRRTFFPANNVIFTWTYRIHITYTICLSKSRDNFVCTFKIWIILDFNFNPRVHFVQQETGNSDISIIEIKVYLNFQELTVCLLFAHF